MTDEIINESFWQAFFWRGAASPSDSGHPMLKMSVGGHAFLSTPDGDVLVEPDSWVFVTPEGKALTASLTAGSAMARMLKSQGQLQRMDELTAQCLAVRAQRDDALRQVAGLTAEVARLKGLVNDLKAPSVGRELISHGEMIRRLDMDLDDVEFSTRTCGYLDAYGLRFVGDLVAKTEREIMSAPNIGRKSLNEIKDALGSLGLSLGMSVPFWRPPRREVDLAARPALVRADSPWFKAAAA